VGATISARLNLVFQMLKTGKPRLLQGYVDQIMQEILISEDLRQAMCSQIAECVVSWKVELQDTIALSMTEMEYMAAVEASKKALWLR